MHLRILPDYQNHGLKKNNFLGLKWLKMVFWCICAYFPPTRIMAWKKYFFRSELVKKMFWCICAFFQTTRIMAWKIDIFRVKKASKPKKLFKTTLDLKKYIFWGHYSSYFQTIRFMAWKKNIFLGLKLLKRCFDAFAHTSRTPKSWP